MKRIGFLLVCCAVGIVLNPLALLVAAPGLSIAFSADQIASYFVPA